MEFPLYPIKFIPILKEKVWGGTKLMTHLHKKSTASAVGESWEISGVEDNLSLVANGQLKNQSIEQLIQKYKGAFMGQRVYATFGNTFPLLFKFIDAKEALSVQLHPNDALAAKRHNCFGKTEMWYIIDHDKDAELILGFTKKVSQEALSNHIEMGTLESVLNRKKIQKGDSFYITPGLVHAIGAGVLLAEIQQTSDITYRIFDWNRPDSEGKLRELHKQQAQEAIDLNANNNPSFENKEQTEGLLVESAYFSVSVLNTLDQSIRDLSNIDSFVVYMCVEGSTTISIHKHLETLHKGETVLIPAQTNKVSFQKSNAKVLEIFVPNSKEKQ